MRAVVTGAAGFIGSHLVDRLLADGHRVVAVDDLSSGDLGNLKSARSYESRHPGRFVFLRNDVQLCDFFGIIAGCLPDVVFHLAAQVNGQASIDDPQFDARSNVLGTINLCEASRRVGVRRVVYASSVEAHGMAGHWLESDDPLWTPHTVAKLAGELYLRAYAAMYGIHPIHLVLSEVYGPRQHRNGVADVIARTAGAVAAKRPLVPDDTASGPVDFVYVDDVVEARGQRGLVSPAPTASDPSP